uniref:Oxidoreductase n=1 Tax=Heterorhabditis bacteriophora TaxID=37862 RepID=A0A1I7WAZ1_HETBA
MLLKHATKYDLYSVKVFSPTVLADIGFDVLKLRILMSMTLNDPQRPGTPRTAKTDALKSLLDGNPSQT